MPCIEITQIVELRRIMASIYVYISFLCVCDFNILAYKSILQT